MNSSLGSMPVNMTEEIDSSMIDIPEEPDVASSNQITTDAVKDAIYKHCTAQPPNTIFSQADLLQTGLIPENSAVILQGVTSALTSSGHLRLMQKHGAACWRCVSPSISAALSSLDLDTMLVYSHVESAGRDGIWKGSLRKRTRFHQAILDKAIKSLESKRLIKNVLDYRHPNRKTFMLWGLQPVESVTGGAFFDKGELDEEFIRQMSTYIEKWVIGRSWLIPKDHDHHTQGRKRKLSVHGVEAKEALETRRAQALDGASTHDDRSAVMRPLLPSQSRYPSIGEVTNALNDSGISKLKLRVADAQLLVDILVWDGKFERLRKRDRNGNVSNVYRAIRNVSREFYGEDTAGMFGPTALTEAPCGRCPVFEFCEEGGLVSARTCPYFQQWLDI